MDRCRRGLSPPVQLAGKHSRAAWRADELAEGRPRAGDAYRALAQRVREVAVNAGIRSTSMQATASLLKAAWALALGDRRPNRSFPVARI